MLNNKWCVLAVNTQRKSPVLLVVCTTGTHWSTVTNDGRMIKTQRTRHTSLWDPVQDILYSGCTVDGGLAGFPVHNNVNHPMYTYMSMLTSCHMPPERRLLSLDASSTLHHVNDTRHPLPHIAYTNTHLHLYTLCTHIRHKVSWTQRKRKLRYH